MTRTAIATLLRGESATIAGATVTRVGLTHYTVNGGPAVTLDNAATAVDALRASSPSSPPRTRETLPLRRWHSIGSGYRRIDPGW
jgi:hypothetical protein